MRAALTLNAMLVDDIEIGTSVLAQLEMCDNTRTTSDYLRMLPGGDYSS